MEKDFEGWHKIKSNLQRNINPATFKECEIWWGGVGVNVGDEEDGKGDNFRRPILVVRKFNKRIFWGIPLTTQVKDKPHYYKIHFQGKIQCVMLTQMKLYDSRRLASKMGQLTIKQMKGIREALRKLIP